MSAADEFRSYVYWSARAREYAADPRLGYASESYRGAAQMAARSLGRWDVLIRTEVTS